jgi:hypothetical protein
MSFRWSSGESRVIHFWVPGSSRLAAAAGWQASPGVAESLAFTYWRFCQ